MNNKIQLALNQNDSNETKNKNFVAIVAKLQKIKLLEDKESGILKFFTLCANEKQKQKLIKEMRKIFFIIRIAIIVKLRVNKSY